MPLAISVRIITPLATTEQALEYHKQAPNIAKEVGDKAREGRAYGNLGKDYHRTGLLWDLSSPRDCAS